MFGLSTTELIAIVLVVLLLFGGKKIPELMRGLGQGVRSFKQGLNEVKKDINVDEDVKNTPTDNASSDNTTSSSTEK